MGTFSLACTMLDPVSLSLILQARTPWSPPTTANSAFGGDFVNGPAYLDGNLWVIIAVG